MAATIYTVPAATTTHLTHMRIVNTTATAATITMSIGLDAVGTRILSAVSIPGNGILDWTGMEIMNAADVLQASQGTAGALTVTISGVEAT